MVIVFVVLVLAVMVTANWYVWRRLFRDTTSGPGWARRAGAAVIVGGWLMAFGALVAERTGAPFWLQRTLAWPGFLWLALSMYLLLGLLVGEVLRPLLRRWLERRKPAEVPVRQTEPVPVGAPPPPEPESPALLAAPSRRLFVSRVIGGAAAAAAVGTVGVGTYGVLKGPSVKRVTVPLAKLPRGAHGYRIAVVSDIHLGPVLGRGFAQKVVDTINSTQPDLVAVVGDLVDGSVKDLGPAAAPLTQLKAPAYFVTGNHEYFSGAEQWVEEVRRLGLLPLENARAELPWFDLAGVNDIAGEDEGQGPDFAKALGDRDPARACVLLAHQPVQIHDAVEHGVDLQLSGHTHGGQLWPGNLIAAGANPTLAGLERYGDTQLYVSRGAGAWGPPTRVGAPSDITVIELASKQA
ncbi:integral membrane protein [Streptomyces davaonensis JCM 4913]|uniref:Integral membrane protein n=1 Tax=Streptomyces davaonensis (strain DSM 101723 / JCM 4913 / KCC S-0913 / 768) TaxID=1214101 RepID=K4R3M6_STRDJ|nr:metallophosphoesterase [Streptomyces davaonensis]CCK27938.1 integral membrane protein [Streptomyces davaonensis JCM 4913]